jgi:thymidylate synthase (FAD)
MPQNLNLEPVTLPMPLRFGEDPQTQFVNDLDALHVELVDSPTAEQIRNVAYRYVKATWADSPEETDPLNATQRTLSETLEDVMQFRALPAGMEAMSFTFLVGGIDLQTVTHLIRHRAGTFAAQCTGDRWQSHSRALVPSAVQNSPEIYDRWTAHFEEGKKLYADMIDTRKISIMDARTILPRAVETFYYARFNLKDLIGFIRQRCDKQIQPAIDNLMAAKMALEVCKVIPEAASVIGTKTLTGPAMHYVRNLRAGTGTNLYWPDSDTDEKIEYHPNDTIYQAERDDVNGTNPPVNESGENSKFRQHWNSLLMQISDIETEYRDRMGY